jgi:uncharacterized protein
MLVLTLLSSLLVGWSAVADLMLGETLYTSRNLALSALLVGAWWQYRSQPWPTVSREMGLAKERTSAGLKWGAGAFFVVAAVLLAGVLLSEMVPLIATLLQDERASMFADDLWYVTLIRIPLGTAVFEEVAFRGVLLAAAMRVTSRWLAVGATSFVFGLWHIPPTMVARWINDVSAASLVGLGTIVGAVLVTTLSGFGFAWLRLASGSLLAPILAHCATNSLALVAAVHVQDLV